jgi:hypothetical protein
MYQYNQTEREMMRACASIVAFLLTYIPSYPVDRHMAVGDIDFDSGCDAWVPAMREGIDALGWFNPEMGNFARAFVTYHLKDFRGVAAQRLRESYASRSAQ